MDEVRDATSTEKSIGGAGKSLTQLQVQPNKSEPFEIYNYSTHMAHSHRTDAYAKVHQAQPVQGSVQ